MTDEQNQLLEDLATKIQEVRDAQPTEIEISAGKAAIERLLQVAERDTGQSRRCGNFLLAWWSARECGGFDLTDLWKLDLDLAQDMVTVFALVSRWQHYPDSCKLGFGKRFEKLAVTWRQNKADEQ